MQTLKFVAIASQLAVVACVLLAVSVQGRAVNISNTWVLPEEGFPVFYRYFRDRISWYEADAVCQFHHGNLVTVDTTSQFDAVRAYLKELDIISNVWIGLTRPSDKTTFSWSGEQPLSGEGFWGEAAALPGQAVCAATDPAADFRWHALTCGGPEIASFICELPVPPWALGADGCMLTSLPSLTVIYLPEQTAVELTSDCGLDGTKRIACKGKADHEEMMRQLSCSLSRDDFDEKAVSKSPSQSTTYDTSSSSISMNSISKITAKTAATKPWIWTSNTIDTGDYGAPTRHRRETEDTFSTAGGLSTTTERLKHTDISVTTSPAKPSSSTSSVYLTTKSSFQPKSKTTEKQFSAATSSPMPETTRQRPSDKSFEPLTTLKPITTTPQSVENTATTGAGEFPSISQGQLFSIIENGTMFDIIEVNDTSSDSVTEKHVKSKMDTLATDKTDKALFTTVSYFKEATMRNDLDEHETPRIDKFLHSKTPNDLSDSAEDKTFMKAIESFPSDSASLVKLNRTNRKELPLVDFNATEEAKLAEHDDYSLSQKQNTSNNDFKEIDKDFTITQTQQQQQQQKEVKDGTDSQHEHKIVEITITDVDRKTDATKLYVTTKKYDKSRAAMKKGDKNDKTPSGKVIDSDSGKTLNAYTGDKTTNNDAPKKNFTADININIEISEMPMENVTELNNTNAAAAVAAAAAEENVRITIDSKLNDLNKNTTIKNVDSEDITGLVLSKPDGDKEKEQRPDVMKQVTIEENGEYDEEGKEIENKDEKTTEEPLEPIPEAQPRPNRNRVLTRPQRRSFYPYFFSRVLG